MKAWRLALCALLPASVALGLATWSALAQQEATPTDQDAVTTPDENEGDEEKERDRAREPIEVVRADQASVDQYDDRESATYLLEGNVHLRQEEVELFADVVRLNQGEDTAEATGNLRVVDPENVIVGDLLMADFGEGRITLTGNVRLVHEETEEQEKEEPPDEETSASEPEPDEPGDGTGASASAQKKGEPETPGNEPKKRTVVTCDRMHYYYDDKRAICIRNVVAKQEDDTVYAHRAIYDEEADILTLTGGVRIEREDGSVFRFKGAVVNLEEDTIQAEGMTNSVLVREKKEQEAAAGAPGAEATEDAEKPRDRRVDESMDPAEPEGG